VRGNHEAVEPGQLDVRARHTWLEGGPGRSHADRLRRARAVVCQGNRATAAARLQASLEQRLERMLRLNPKRVDDANRLRDLIERYNSGSKNIEEFFDELRSLANDLNEQQERHVREQLTEEELVVFDILAKPDPLLSSATKRR